MKRMFRTLDGKFYVIPEKELANYEVSAEQMKDELSNSTFDGSEISKNDLDNISGGTSSEGGIGNKMHQKTLSA